MVKIEDFVALNDRIEPMSYGQHRRAYKFLRNELLDDLFSHYIDICSGFIQENDLVMAKNGSYNADELSLTYT